MRHHILIPTDYSENARNAALYAIRLYADKACVYYFLHAWSFVNTGSRTYIAPDYIDRIKDISKNQLIAIREQAKAGAINKDHEFKSIFTTDPLTDAITTAIGQHKIELLIMGTKGATGAQEFLFGSNAVNVIMKVKSCPVLLVPKDHEFEIPRKIGFPTGFLRTYGEELLAIKKLTALHNASLNILHINSIESLTETQRTNFNILKEYFKHMPHTFFWKFDYTKKEQAIKDFIEENAINVLTMINYKHGFIEDLIKEPVIKKLGYHTEIPFMVLPYPQQ